MAKRFQPLKEFGRTTKKPKLDVSISKGRPLGPTQSWPQMTRPSAGGMGNDIGAASRHVPSPNRISMSHNLWDDDDDDVILLATQVAESQVANKPSASSAVHEITDSDITFSEFAPQLHATTSTQCLNTKPVAMSEGLELTEMFGDDDDFAQMLNVAVEEPIKRNVPTKSNEPSGTFKKPVLPISQSVDTSNKRPDNAVSADGQQAVARRQIASERQIKLLMERLEALKTENAKLSKDLSDSKSKIESKEGESSLLRDELRHMKQQLQSLKMEKIFNTEAVKTECKTKIAELTKRVEAKETELKLRNVEYSVMKMRHADETQRLEMSIRSATLLGDATIEENHENVKNRTNQRSLQRLRSLKLDNAQPLLVSTCDHQLELNVKVYEQTHERGNSKRRHTPFQQELACVQTLLAQLQMQLQKRTWTTEKMQDFNKRTIASVCKAFAEFWTYVHSLEFPKNCGVHSYHDYDLCLDKQLHKRRNLHQSTELYVDESASSLRRYIAALGVMCQQSPPLARELLAAQHGEYALLQVAIDAISKLGFSREICSHFGVVESFAALLHVLLLHAQPNVEQMELLVSLLKQLVFVRPSAWIFREVSYCLLEVMRVPEGLTQLCVNSDESTFFSDRLRSLYRFSNDTCILQVYAGLLEIAFPLNSTLHLQHFQLLAVICENHVRFVHHCFMNPPDFVHKLLPSYDDEEDETEENSNQYDYNIALRQSNFNGTTTTVSDSPSNTIKEAKCVLRCECYTKLCLSVLTLLFQLLRQWIGSRQQMETARVAEISQVSVQLLHIIFCDNYTTRIFRYAEETTKHYLWLICEWWTENADLLLFNNVHRNFLRKLRSSHIMPKQLREEGNISIVHADLSEWYSLTNDKNNDFANNTKDVAKAAEKLKLIQRSGDATSFFEGLKGYAFNFE